MTEEQVREPCPDVEQTLTAVNAAYLSKKARSKQASAVKRMVDRAQPQPEAAPVESLADAVAVVSLEPAEITAEPEPAPQPTPIGGSAPYNPQPRPGGAPEPAKKKGLAGRFA